MSKKGKVIYLNGANCSGKSTIAKMIQKLHPEPYLHIQFDTFIEMLPPNCDAKSFSKMAYGFLHSLKSMIDLGNNLIIDHVLVQDEWLKNSVELLDKTTVSFIQIYCPLDVLEEREKEKYQEIKGIAKSQYEKVYKHETYDLKFDTSKQEPDVVAQKIVDFTINDEPMAFSLVNHL